MSTASRFILAWMGASAAVACSHNQNDGESGSEQTDSAASDSQDSNSQRDTDSHSDSETMQTYPLPCADIYDPNILPTFEVEISPQEWQGVLDDCQAGDTHRYRPIVFRYDGTSAAAMIRLKGNWSFRCDKLQFVISFNETDPDGRFHGLRKIVLDAPWYDLTFLHERMAMFALGRHGVPASCVNNVRLVINGEYYGLYVNVERLDHEYLERHFVEHDGNLYDGGQELKTNEGTADTSRRDAYWAATTLEEIASLVELHEAVSVWAGLAMLPDPDSVWAGVEINFYLYDHPTLGFIYLPYDTDIAFGVNLVDGLASVDPITYEHSEWKRELHYKVVLSDATWCERFVEALRHAHQTYDVPLMQQSLDEWSTQIAAAVSEDPHRPFSFEEHLDAVAQMRAFFESRSRFVGQWLDAGGHCPPVWP